MPSLAPDPGSSPGGGPGGGVLRTLAVMRHAKAEPAGASDLERALAARGHADAEEAGAWLAAAGVRPEHALVSAAHRTVETFEHVRTAAGWSLRPQLDAGLYAADVDTALDLVRATDDDVTTLLVIGHNPTVSYLAQLLDDGEGDAEDATAMVLGLPTAAVAVFGLRGPWAELGAGTARLTGYHVGRA